MMHQASKGIFTGIPHSQIPSLQRGHQPSPIFFLLFLLLSSFLCFYVFLSIRFFSFGEVPPATALSPREAWTNFADLVALARTVSVEQLPGGSSGVFAEIADGVPGVRNLPPNPHHVSILPKKKQVKVAMRWPASQINDFGSARRRMEVRPKEELSTCYGRAPGARRRGQPSPGQGTSHRSWICFSSSVCPVGPSPQPQSWT
ncbi:uncharacterized protein LOC117068065 isoform X2 [Trachypithecus francoisi]|uniref:uncharacterized protein LOC117068065 isoform X2 n=1 Tax=Trachypithecus francoisi TaxID=54180 RepID=UPI00141B7B38|nr:uncharacterized protein LOC117068065 isoform X2 [Trachypithecus francoisi]XP_033041191.1 uncharacterized protein LOC117068065 isoform X2 [Trachypithecus francoisi]